MDDAAKRREARRSWTGQRFSSWSEAEEHDALFWSRIPVDERARVTWQLSVELWNIAHPEAPYTPEKDLERRLSRSVTRVTRR